MICSDIYDVWDEHFLTAGDWLYLPLVLDCPSRLLYARKWLMRLVISILEKKHLVYKYLAEGAVSKYLPVLLSVEMRKSASGGLVAVVPVSSFVSI